MKLLAFDTCLDKTYITLCDNGKIIRSVTIYSDGENYHSAYLISSIAKILKSAELKPSDIDLIATDIGPGSFTGIRACTTVARVLAQQLNIKTIGISSLEILSRILGGNDMVALDARKNKAYVYENKILGAVNLDTVDKMVSGKILITDNSLLKRFNELAGTVVSYQNGNFELGNILAEIASEKEPQNWQKLKPLYIQPPPVFGK